MAINDSLLMRGSDVSKASDKEGPGMTGTIPTRGTAQKGRKQNYSSHACLNSRRNQKQ
jgi:hypothetical protein